MENSCKSRHTLVHTRAGPSEVAPTPTCEDSRVSGRFQNAIVRYPLSSESFLLAKSDGAKKRSAHHINNEHRFLYDDI